MSLVGGSPAFAGRFACVQHIGALADVGGHLAPSQCQGGAAAPCKCLVAAVVDDAGSVSIPTSRFLFQTSRIQVDFSMSRQIQMMFRATGALMFVVVALSGCAAISPPPDPQQQLVISQRDARGVYEKKLISYKALAENPNTYSRTQILEAYQALLYQYSVAAVNWVRVVYPAARQTLPPSLQPFPVPSGTPTLADVNQNYEHALEMNAAMWDINGAADGRKPSKLSIPKYTGTLVIMPSAPPLPPLQDVRDPKYARLVAMTRKVDEAQKADLAQQRIAIDKQIAENNAWRAAHVSHEYDSIDPRTGRPYPAPQQEVQRWCTISGGGVVSRVPC